MSARRQLKRDLDLVLKLLIFFEDRPGPEYVQQPAIDGCDETAIKYHLVLMYEAGLLRCEPTRSSTSDRVIYVLPFDLTWKGHEFLDKVRNERVWERMKATVLSKGGTLAFDVVYELAKKFAMKAIEHA